MPASIGLKNNYNRKSYLHTGLEHLVATRFPYAASRFKIIPELQKYRVSANPEIYGQKAGTQAEVCEVYFDGEFLCDITSKLRPDEAEAKINFWLIQKLQKKGGGKR